MAVPDEHAGAWLPFNHRITGGWILAVSVLAFLVATSPVLISGAPLLDDFRTCVGVEQLGFAEFSRQTFEEVGVTRPARFIEISLISRLCRRSGQLLILFPLCLTLAVSFQVRALLRDLDVGSPWAEVGGALWLMQPLGAEAALWPSALHVPLGLVCGIASVRLFRRSRWVLASVLALISCLCIEQAIFVLPAGAWLVSPKPSASRSLAACLVISLVVVTGYSLWPGSNPRTDVALLDRFRNIVADPEFYVIFPLTSLGVRSVPLGIWWAFPYSALLLAVGLAAGWWMHSAFTAPSGPRLIRQGNVKRFTGAVILLLILTNIPVAVTLPHEDSPRVFTPSWVILCLCLSILGSGRTPSRRVTSAMGTLAAAFLVCIAFSVSVRQRSAGLVENGLRRIAIEVPDGGVAAICDVRRTVVEPAPTGAYAVHELLYTWSAESALRFYTGKEATVFIGGQYHVSTCPDTREADAVFRFDDLLVDRSQSP